MGALLILTASSPDSIFSMPDFLSKVPPLCIYFSIVDIEMHHVINRDVVNPNYSNKAMFLLCILMKL